MSGGTLRIWDGYGATLYSGSYFGPTCVVEFMCKGDKMRIELSESSTYMSPASVYQPDMASALAPLVSKITELLEVATTEREMYRVRAEEWEKVAREREKSHDESKQNP